MRKIILLFSFYFVFAFQGWGQTPIPVKLQATTPGVQQTGNVNISGTLRAGSYSATGVFVAPAGTHLLPSYTFTSDLDTGIYQISGGRIGFTANGNPVFEYTTTGISTGRPYRSTVITGEAPLVVDSTTKVANLNADIFDDLDSSAFGQLSAANTWTGKQGVDMTTETDTSIAVDTGSAATPALSHLVDVDTGIYFDGSNNLLVSNGGSLKWTFLSSGKLKAGTTGVIWNDSSGWYICDSGGSSYTNLYTKRLFSDKSLDVTKPDYSYGADSNCGYASLATDQLDLVTNGVSRFVVTTTAATNTFTGLTAATCTANYTGRQNSGSHSYSWTNAMVVALDTSHDLLTADLKVCTLPAKTRIKNAYIVINTAATGTGVDTLTVSLGGQSESATPYDLLLGAGDAMAVANTVYGDASGERGTNLTGYYLPSVTATEDVYLTFTMTTASGKSLEDVLTSTGTVYLETELLQ